MGPLIIDVYQTCERAAIDHSCNGVRCWVGQMFKVGSPVYFKPTWLFVLCVWSCRAGQWELARWESGLNSRHSPPSETTLCLVCLRYNLSYILRVFVRALCQTHWLWKNNLTGFNLLPPHPPSSSLLPLAFFFFFCCFCVPLRGWEFILFGNSMPSPSSHCKLDEPGFMAALRPPVKCGLSLKFACHMWFKRVGSGFSF